MKKILDHAQHLAENGLSVIPIRADGSKAPAISQWKEFQSTIADPATLEAMFSGGVGIGIIGGKVSGNLEVLDFEAGAPVKEWADLVKSYPGGADLLGRLPAVKTPTGGWHFPYRCRDGVEGNQKLAQTRIVDKDGNEKTKVLIETRASKGYVIAPGSPGACHPTGKPYELVKGDLAHIPVITGEERALLLDAARSFNELIKPKQVISGASEVLGNRPGDDFNIRASWEEILQPHGWEQIHQREAVTYWRRPGKKLGVSATTNHAGTNLFYCFSSNGDPFQAETAYTLFAAYTFLNHNGDFSLAAADLARKGYGEPEGTSFASFASFAEQPQVKNRPFFASFASFAQENNKKWPAPLAEEAFYGLAGEFVHAIEPHTEADPAALLLQKIVAYGNCVGSEPHFRAEAQRHGMNEFLNIVGKTSKGRKGSAWSHVRKGFEAVDEEWTRERIQSGLSSGEGLIWAVRDSFEKMEPIKEKGRVVGYQTVISDQGVEDKRLLIQEGEFASTLKVLRREGNTLSPVMRNAWDTGYLNTLTKNSPAKASGAHISIIGHITEFELLRSLDDTEAANGFANRFLWACCQRSKVLPEGGCIQQVNFEPLISRLRQAIDCSRKTGELRRDEAARAIWCDIYPDLSEGKPGLYGAMIARAEAHVMRLACIYALLDQSDLVRKEHLLAAIAVWEYCEASCRYLFGDKFGDPIADAILGALRQSAEGLTRADIHSLFKRHVKAGQLDRALSVLETAGFARKMQRRTDGRPAEVWFAT